MKKKNFTLLMVLFIMLYGLMTSVLARTTLASEGFTPIYVGILGEEEAHEYMDETTQYIHPREGYSDEYMAINLEKAFTVYAEAWEKTAWKLPSKGLTTEDIKQLVPNKVQQLEAGEKYLLRFYIGALFNPNITLDQFAKAKTLITTRSQNKNLEDDSDEIVIEEGLLTLVVPQENIWVDYENIRLKMDETIGSWWGPMGQNSSSPFKGTTNALKENPESIYKWDLNKRPFETLNKLEAMCFREPSELGVFSQFIQSLLKNTFKETITIPFGYAGTAIGIMGSTLGEVLPSQPSKAQFYQTMGKYNLNKFNIFEIVFPPQTTFRLHNAIVEIPIEVKAINESDVLAFYLLLNEGKVAFYNEWKVSQPLYESAVEESPDEGDKEKAPLFSMSFEVPEIFLGIDKDKLGNYSQEGDNIIWTREITRSTRDNHGNTYDIEIESWSCEIVFNTQTKRITVNYYTLEDFLADLTCINYEMRFSDSNFLTTMIVDLVGKEISDGVIQIKDKDVWGTSAYAWKGKNLMETDITLANQSGHNINVIINGLYGNELWWNRGDIAYRKNLFLNTAKRWSPFNNVNDNGLVKENGMASRKMSLSITDASTILYEANAVNDNGEETTVMVDGIKVAHVVNCGRQIKQDYVSDIDEVILSGKKAWSYIYPGIVIAVVDGAVDITDMAISPDAYSDPSPMIINISEGTNLYPDQNSLNIQPIKQASKPKHSVTGALLTPLWSVYSLASKETIFRLEGESTVLEFHAGNNMGATPINFYFYDVPEGRYKLNLYWGGDIVAMKEIDVYRDITVIP